MSPLSGSKSPNEAAQASEQADVGSPQQGQSPETGWPEESVAATRAARRIPVNPLAGPQKPWHPHPGYPPQSGLPGAPGGFVVPPGGMSGSAVKVDHTATARGDGALTAAALANVLAQVPPEAVLVIRTVGDQRDGSSWHVSASW